MADGEVSEKKAYAELGSTGLKRWGGYVDEEFLPQLRGQKAVAVFNEMQSNDPVVGAVVFAVDMLLRQITWRAEPASGDMEDQRAAMFLDECMGDMSHTFEDLISEILSMLVFGWSWHEVVYKRRIGDVRNPRFRSKYNDGLIGWRKMPIRAQETLHEWDFGDDGGIDGMWQNAPPDYQMVHMPIEKSLLFRTSIHKNNPEGRGSRPEEPIWTPDGWTTMGDLSPGDRVYDETGASRRVMATKEWHDRPQFRVTFFDGTSGVFDANHQWVVSTAQQRNKGRPTKIKTTGEIAESFSRSVVNRYNGVIYAQPTQAPQRDLHVDPWVLGYWLGNGHRGSAQMSCHADDGPEITALIEEAGYVVKAVDDTREHHNGLYLNMRGLKTGLREIGVLDHKSVPGEYLSASEQQRRALLAGLLDSDGHCDEFGRVEFSNTNRDLIDAVAHLVRSLGMAAFVTQSRPAIPDEGWAEVWDVKFTPCGQQVFRLARKQGRVRDDVTRRTHFITSIEPVENGTTVCIEVDSPSHLYLTGEGMIPTHNSILRNAYRPWYYKKRMEEVEGIGIERDLAGLPVAKIPAKYLHPNASEDEQAIANAFKKMVRNVRRDEQEGLVLPKEFDEDGNEVYEFELLNSGGSRQINIDTAITRYEQRIAMTILADFILLGHENVGSYALSVNKTGIFRTALNAWADSVAEVFNRHEIPRLFDLNGWRLAKYPSITPGEVDPPDISELGQFIQHVSGAGMQLFPDPELENFIRDAAKLPQKSEEAEMQQQMAQQEEMAREERMAEAEGNGHKKEGPEKTEQFDPTAM